MSSTINDRGVHLFINSIAAFAPLLLRSQPIEGSCSCCNALVPVQEAETIVDEDGDEVDAPQTRLPLWFRTRAGDLFCPTCSKAKARDLGWRLELPSDTKKRAQIEILEIVRSHPGIGAIRISSLLQERAQIAYTPRVVLLALGQMAKEGLVIRLGAENREAMYRYNSELDFEGQEIARELQQRKLDRELSKCKPAAAAQNNVVPIKRSKVAQKSGLGRDRLPEIASLIADGRGRSEIVEETGLSLGQVAQARAAIGRWFGDRRMVKSGLRVFLESPRKAFKRGLRKLSGEAMSWVKTIATGETKIADTKHKQGVFRCFLAWLKLLAGCNTLEELIAKLQGLLSSQRKVVPLFAAAKQQRARVRAIHLRVEGRRGKCPVIALARTATKYTLAA